MIHIFIYNPETGDDGFSENLRAGLENRRKTIDPDFQYFVFTTRYAGHESELIGMVLSMFEGDELRIYCCGGSGTIRNIVSGIEDLSSVEIAFYPCGLSNDLLKCFGSDRDFFRDIDALIEGRVIKIDYIDTDHGPALNAVSTGLDSVLIRNIESMRGMMEYLTALKKLPYIISLIKSIIFMRRNEYIITIDGIELDVKACEVIFKNGCALGGGLHTAEMVPPLDGLATYSIVTSGFGIRFLRILKNIARSYNKSVRKLILTGKAGKMSLRRRDGAAFDISLDGELITIKEISMTVVRNGLRFVIPKGVQLDESI